MMLNSFQDEPCSYELSSASPGSGKKITGVISQFFKKKQHQKASHQNPTASGFHRSAMPGNAIHRKSKLLIPFFPPSKLRSPKLGAQPCSVLLRSTEALQQSKDNPATKREKRGATLHMDNSLQAACLVIETLEGTLFFFDTLSIMSFREWNRKW